MKAKDNMQGLPIQQLMKAPIKGDGKAQKASSHVVIDEDSSPIEGAISSDGSKVVKGNIDFASLLKNINGEEKLDSKVEKNSNETKDKNSNLSTEAEVETAIAKTSGGLEQLLNVLKGTSDNESSEKVDTNLKKINLENQKTPNESPLDFIVRGSKENKVSDNISEYAEQKGDVKKSFFPNAEKIANNIQLKNQENEFVQVGKENVKLVSGEEFVDAKNIKPEFKLNDGKNPSVEKSNVVDITDILKNKSKDVGAIKGYQHGQNLLNDNMIKNTKDLAFKEQKKGKISATDELLSSDMKVSNELSMIKENPIPMISAKLVDTGVSSKNTEAPKVLDMNKMNITTTSQLIDKISDYVMQSNVAGKDQIDLTVKHDSIGQFQIQVTKNPTLNQPHQIDMQIMTNSQEGHKFFVENESALMKSLQQSGVSLSDLRIVTNMSESTMNSFTESKQSNSFDQNRNSSSSQSFESFQSGDFRQGSEKRKNLWNEYREKYGA